MTKILRKLTIKEVMGSKAELLKIACTGLPFVIGENGVATSERNTELAEGLSVDLCSIIGRVAGVKPGESDTGPFVKLIGDFEATNLVTGEVIGGVTTCILPNFVADAIASAVKAGAQSVDFAVKLSIKYKKSAATMYEFAAESLIPVATANSVSDIKQRLLGLGVQLPVAKLAAPAPAAAAATTEPAAAAAPAPAENVAPIKGSKGAKVA